MEKVIHVITLQIVQGWSERKIFYMNIYRVDGIIKVENEIFYYGAKHLHLISTENLYIVYNILYIHCYYLHFDHFNKRKNGDLWTKLKL